MIKLFQSNSYKVSGILNSYFNTTSQSVFISFAMYMACHFLKLKCSILSLSTVVLNSKDWSEMIWLPKILHFKNQPCNGLYPKNLHAGMHWLSYNAVSWLNKAKTQIFQPTANFETFKTNLYLICLPACQSASQPACLPAIRPSCARCRAPEISYGKGNGGRFMKMLFRRQFTHCAMAIPFILPCSSLFM